MIERTGQGLVRKLARTFPDFNPDSTKIVYAKGKAGVPWAAIRIRRKRGYITKYEYCSKVHLLKKIVNFGEDRVEKITFYLRNYLLRA